MHSSSLKTTFSTHMAASTSSQPIPIPGAPNRSSTASPESPAEKVRRVSSGCLARVSLCPNSPEVDLSPRASSPLSDVIPTAVFGVLDPNTPYFPAGQFQPGAHPATMEPMHLPSSASISEQRPHIHLEASSESSFWDELESIDGDLLSSEGEGDRVHSDEMQASPVGPEGTVDEERENPVESGSVSAWQRESSLDSGSFTSSLGTSREGQAPSSDPTISAITASHSGSPNTAPLAERRGFGSLCVDLETGSTLDPSQMEPRQRISRGVRFSPNAWRMAQERRWEPGGLCDQLTLAWLEGSGVEGCSDAQRAFLRSVHPVSFASSILPPLERLSEALGPVSKSPQEPRGGWRPLYLSERFYMYCLQDALWGDPQNKAIFGSKLASYCLSRWLGLAWQASGSLRWPEMQVSIRGNGMRLTETLFREETLQRMRAGEPVGIDVDPAQVETGLLFSLIDEHERWGHPLVQIKRRVSLRGFIEELPDDSSIDETDEWLRRWEAILPLLALAPTCSPLSLATLVRMDRPAFDRLELLAKAALCVHGEVSWVDVVEQALHPAGGESTRSEDAYEGVCRRLSSRLNERLKQQGVSESTQRLRHLVEHPFVLLQHAGVLPEQVAESLKTRGEALFLLISQFPWAFLAAARGHPELLHGWQQMQLDELKCWLDFGWEAWSLKRSEERGKPHPLLGVRELAQQISGLTPTPTTFSGWPPLEASVGPILQVLHQINQGLDPVYWSRLFQSVLQEAAEHRR